MTTAIFAACGMPVTTFLVAAFISLPKQFAAVYLGYAEEFVVDGKTPLGVSIIKITVILITVVVTFLAMRWINARIDEVKDDVVHQRRKARWVPYLQLPPSRNKL